MLKTILITEWIKNKHTITPWFLLIGSVLVPFVCFMIYLNRWSLFLPETGSSGWIPFLHMNVSFYSMLMLPIWLILLVALNIYPEQKSNAWKRLFVTPVGKGHLFVGKWVYLCLQVVLTVTGFMVAIGVSGVWLHAMHPELSLPLSRIPVGSLLGTLASLWVCLLPMLTLQYVFSLFTNNVLIPAMAGLFLLVISMVLVQGWSYAVYDPYAFLMLLSWHDTGNTTLPFWLGLPSICWLSLIFSAIVGVLGWWKFRRAVLS